MCIINCDSMNYRGIFLTSLVIALIISALIGIYLFLVGEFNETETKILLTTLVVGWYSLTGLCSSVVHQKEKLSSFSMFGMLVSILGFVVTVVAIWYDKFDSDIWKAVMVFVVLSVSMSHVSLLLLVKPVNSKIKISMKATFVFITIVALMLIKSILNEFEEDEFYFRLLGVFAILDVLGTIATPLMNKISSNG